MIKKIFVPIDTTAIALGSNVVAEIFENALKENGSDIQLIRNGSRGMFWLEPLIEFENNNGRFSFKNVVPSDVLPIMQLLEADDFESLATGNEKFLGNTKEIEYLQNQSRLSFSKACIGDPLCL